MKKNRKVGVAAAGFVVAALALSACGGGDTPPPPAPAPSSSSADPTASPSATSIIVPDLAGVPQADAAAELAAKGLVLGNVYESTVPGAIPGSVVSQAPGAGMSVLPGATVDLTVAATLAKVPALLSLNEKAAIDAITAAGFVVGDIRKVNSSEKAGEVVAQSPHSNEQAPKGSVVNIRISNGTEGVIDVVGLSEASAKAALADAGLKVAVETEFSLENKGTVVKQTPKASTRVKLGSTVTITVSKGPEPAPQPKPTPTPEPKPTPIKPAKCDLGSISDAINKELTKSGQVIDTAPATPVKFKCADGWAAASAQVATTGSADPAPLVQQFVFQAEGQFWVPVKAKVACAPGSDIPDSLRKLGCDSLLG